MAGRRSQDGQRRARRRLWHRFGNSCRHARQPLVSTPRSHEEEGRRQDRTGANRAGAAQRLDYLFSSADLSRPQGLQSAPSVVRRVRGREIVSFFDVEDWESAEVAAFVLVWYS